MSAPQDTKEVWTSGYAYEPYVGRWSRVVADEFLDWLALPPASRWLDVGCGTGALSEAIIARSAPRGVVGVDHSEAYVAHARRRNPAPLASFRVADARSLPVEDDAFDAAVAGLVLNFVPEPPTALREMRRAVRQGGTLAAYVWDYAGEMQLMRRFWDAAIALDPAARELDEGRRFPLCKPDPLASLFRSAGLQDVAVRAIDAPTVFRDFTDFWSPFLGGQGPAPGYCMALPEDRRAALRDRLQATFPARPDGSIHLIARAFAVRGTIPS